MATDLAWKIPDNISYEQAATVSVGLYSAAMCMTHPKRLDMSEWPEKISNDQWVSKQNTLLDAADHPRCPHSPLFHGSSDIWVTRVPTQLFVPPFYSFWCTAGRLPSGITPSSWLTCLDTKSSPRPRRRTTRRSKLSVPM